MVSPERLDALQARWVRLLAVWGVTPADAYPVFDRLAAAYSEPHRHYHTLEHLAEVFRVVGRLGATPAVELAVWFHDAVSDPRASDNEARSADLVAEWLTPLGVPTAVSERVAELVRATAHLTADPTRPDPEVLALRDADLAILGASEARYRRYATDIRREYAHVSDDDYRRGRAAVLRGFLGRAAIFHHPLMLAEGEAAARQNLLAELTAQEPGASATG
jgi:predicted metal-dependent HD superfamily phosphohydrolase